MSYRCPAAFVPVFALGLLAAVTTPGTLRAEEGRNQEPSLQSQAEQMVMDVLRRAMDFVSSLGSLVPYELPEQLPNGDIIIRRKLPGPFGADAPGTTQL